MVLFSSTGGVNTDRFRALRGVHELWCDMLLTVEMSYDLRSDQRDLLAMVAKGFEVAGCGNKLLVPENGRRRRRSRYEKGDKRNTTEGWILISQCS